FSDFCATEVVVRKKHPPEWRFSGRGNVRIGRPSLRGTVARILQRPSRLRRWSARRVKLINYVSNTLRDIRERLVTIGPAGDGKCVSWKRHELAEGRAGPIARPQDHGHYTRRTAVMANHGIF